MLRLAPLLYHHGEMFNIMPMDEEWNEDHTQDLNAVHELTFVSFTSRVGVDVTGSRDMEGRLDGKGRSRLLRFQQ